MANPFSLYDDEENKLLDISQFAAPSPYEVYNKEVPMPDSIVQRFRGLASATQKSPEQKALEQAQEQAYQQSVKNQEALIPQLEQNYQNYGNSQEKDISGILGAVDLLGGTNTLAKYQKPESPDDVAYKKALLGQMVQKAKEGVTETQLKRLGQVAQSKNEQKVLEMMARQGRYDESNLLKKEDNIKKDLDASVIKPYSEKQQQFGLLDEAFSKGDYQTVGATLAQFARGVSGEKGVLTDNDISRIMPKNIYGDAARIRSYFSKTPSDKLPPEYLDKLKELVSTAKANADKVYGDILKSKRGIYSNSKSYSPLFSKGESGDLMFSEVESKFTPKEEAVVAPAEDVPTKIATDAKGNKLGLINGKWVPVK